MSRFDFGKIKEKAKELFAQEVESSRSVQDEIKIFNERFPEWLKPLEKLTIGDSSGVGEFNDEGGSGVGGELGYVEAGKYWTSDDLTQHDLTKTISTLTAGQIDAWIMDKAGHRTGSKMHGQGEAYMEAGRVYGLDPRYIAAHSALESAWGTSNIVMDKNNFYGIGAFDASPYESAYTYDSPKDGIMEGAKFIREDYTDGRNANTLTKMHVDYATDPNWAKGIASTMKGFDAFTTPSEGGAPAGGSFDGTFQNPYRNEPHTITSEFGTRGGKHKGIDIQSHKHRVNMYATAPGKIVKNETNYGKTGWGNYVVIDHGAVKGKNVYSLYAHMTDPSPHKEGSSIGSDALIGKEGNTGYVKGVTGIHLHLEIREGSPGNWSNATPVNPRNYISF